MAILAITFAQAANTPGQQPTLQSLEAHILQEVSVEPVDCGTHPLFRPDPDALHQSLACAQDARKNHLAFKLMQRGPGTDGPWCRFLQSRRSGDLIDRHTETFR